MTSDPTPTRSEIRERYEQDAPTDGHVNYGDANPDAHGGLWMSYDPDFGEWEVFETVPACEYYDDADDEDWGDQFVRLGYVDWDFIITEDGQWTDHFGRHVGEVHRSHDRPIGAVVDGDLEAHIAHWVSQRADPEGRLQKDSYADVLAAHGIEPIE